jgi:hypothetical protein
MEICTVSGIYLCVGPDIGFSHVYISTCAFSPFSERENLDLKQKAEYRTIIMIFYVVFSKLISHLLSLC